MPNRIERNGKPQMDTIKSYSQYLKISQNIHFKRNVNINKHNFCIAAFNQCVPNVTKSIINKANVQIVYNKLKNGKH